MAYRFTNTEKWSDTWFLELKPIQKLLFLYLCDQCDIAGFIEVNERKFAFDLCTDKQAVNAALKGIEQGILFSSDRKVIFVRNFIRHQKNLPLDRNIKVRSSILDRLENNRKLFNFQSIDSFFLTLAEPLTKGYGNTNSNIEDKDKGGMGEKEKGEPKTPYEKFNFWLDITCPNVRKMSRQITDAEFSKLQDKYSSTDIRDILEKMENTNNLSKKYTWVYKTALNWLERRENVAKR